MGGAPTRHRTVIGVLLALVLAATACSAPVRLPDDATPLPSAQNGDAEPEEERELSLAEQLEALEAENEAARAANERRVFNARYILPDQRFVHCIALGRKKLKPVLRQKIRIFVLQFLE